MPVREKAVDKILRTIVGDQRMSFNNVHWTAQVGDEVMTRDEFDERYWEPVERAYEVAVDSIDWNRVLLEASSRHISLDHPADDYYGLICPECINEALLADSTFVDWRQTPNIPRQSDTLETS